MNFTVFSKKGCPHCEKVKKILELTSSKFVVYNLDEHFDTKAFCTAIVVQKRLYTNYVQFLSGTPGTLGTLGNDPPGDTPKKA